MRTDAIVGGFLLLLVWAGSAVAQPAAPLIPLEPEKPIDATEVETESQEPAAPAENPIEAEPAPRESAPIPGLIEEREPSRPVESGPSNEQDESEAEDQAPAEAEARPLTERESEDLDSDDPNSDDPNSDDPDSEESQPSSAIALPSNCEPLPLVGGEGSEVTKRTSAPSFALPLPLPGPLPSPRFRSNWNTDWYIPNAQEYQHYRVVLLPHNDADYSIQMHLKYPDDTADEFYEEQDIRLTANEPLIVETEPRSDLLPYQINANIGGLLSIGVRYTIAVAGCR